MVCQGTIKLVHSCAPETCGCIQSVFLRAYACIGGRGLAGVAAYVLCGAFQSNGHGGCRTAAVVCGLCGPHESACVHLIYLGVGVLVPRGVLLWPQHDGECTSISFSIIEHSMLWLKPRAGRFTYTYSIRRQFCSWLPAKQRSRIHSSRSADRHLAAQQQQQLMHRPACQRHSSHWWWWKLGTKARRL